MDKKPAATAVSKPAVKKARKGGFFSFEPIAFDLVADADAEDKHFHQTLSSVYRRGIIISLLCGALVLIMPFAKPIYHHYARDPAGNILSLSALPMPNMTNRAVISWAVNSVTEIMTFGFGDIIEQLGRQKPRFTPDGWRSFVEAFQKQKVSQAFKEKQIVLTTVPSNTPVIISQGLNKDGQYQWVLQIPVIMTYATNNNVTKPERAVISLTIVRVSTEQSPSGIAIKKWIVS
ncbi:MAG: DotI/IcmL/TraM family protein [Bdellovibrionales bacterium]